MLPPDPIADAFERQKGCARKFYFLNVGVRVPDFKSAITNLYESAYVVAGVCFLLEAAAAGGDPTGLFATAPFDPFGGGQSETDTIGSRHAKEGRPRGAAEIPVRVPTL